MEALVLAGGTSGIKGLSTSPAHKADLLIGEKAMVDHVVAALSQAQQIRHVHVARGSGDSMVTNLLDAVERLDCKDDEYVLISACDIPFLTTQAIDDFLEKCHSGADVYYPIVRREACMGRFPGVKRTYARLREGTFTGGNLFLVKKGILPPLANWIQTLFLLRKSPLRLARLFGYSLLLRFLLSSLFGTLPIRDLEKWVWELTGIRAQAVISDYAEIGTDIDKAADFELLSSSL